MSKIKFYKARRAGRDAVLHAQLGNLWWCGGSVLEKIEEELAVLRPL